MNRLLAIVLAASCAAPLVARQDAPASQTESPSKPEFSDADKAEAQQLLEKVVEAYRTAPTLTDTVVMSVGPEQQSIKLKFGRDNQRVEMAMPGLSLTKVGDRLYFADERSPEKYLDVVIEQDMIATIESLFGASAGLPFQMYARFGRDVDAMLESMLPQTSLLGMRTVTNENDQEVHEVFVNAANGTLVLTVDPVSKMVRRVNLELTPPEELGMGESFKASITTSPVIADTLADPIVFEPGDRTAVSDLEAMVPEPPVARKAGDEAPHFELKSIEGEMVSLADLEGSVVVLDFWATWCLPCIRAMPKIDEFAEWAKNSPHPIKVYAINVWERAQGEKRLDMVREFWREKGFKLTSLIDEGDKVIATYGYQSIPTTVVIGPDGTIVKVHVGFSPQIDQELRDEALKALGEKG